MTSDEFIKAGGKVTKCPTVFLVPSPQGSRQPQKKEIKAAPRRPGGWAKYWAKRRALTNAVNP